MKGRAPLELHYWGHASYSVFNAGCHLLMDPILEDPFECGFTYFNPPRRIEKEKIPPADAIYISHRHQDHFDEKTLKYFLKDKPQIFCPDILLKDLGLLGFDKIAVLKPYEERSFGPFVFMPTPSVAPFNELGLLIKASDMAVWNQVDTSVNWRCIQSARFWAKGIDVLLAPFQPLKEYCQHWPEETAFPKKRLENMLMKAMAAHAEYIVPSSSSIRMGGECAWINSRAFSISKPQFIERLKEISPDVKAFDIEAGDSLILKQGERAAVRPSFFIQRAGKRIDDCGQPHSPAPPLDLTALSAEERKKIVFHGEKLPQFLSDMTKKRCMAFFEILRARDFSIAVEIAYEGGKLSFVLRDRIQKIVWEDNPKNWDYLFKYSAADLLKKAYASDMEIPYYAYRAPGAPSPLSLYGYDEDHVVDGGAVEYHIFSHWPFSGK